MMDSFRFFLCGHNADARRAFPQARHQIRNPTPDSAIEHM
jgi:hypothetical protein